MPNLTDREKALIVERYRDGQSMRSLAQMFKVAPSTIRYHLKNAEVVKRTRTEQQALSRVTLTEAQKDEIAQRSKNDEPYESIADAFGIHPQYARAIARKRGAPDRYRRKLSLRDKAGIEQLYREGCSMNRIAEIYQVYTSTIWRLFENSEIPRPEWAGRPRRRSTGGKPHAPHCVGRAGYHCA